MHARSDLAPNRSLDPAVVLFPVAHLALEVYNSALSIMWPLLTVRFGLSFGAVGLLNMIFRGTMTLPQLAFAPLSDRWGSKWLGVVGLAWMAAGMSLVGVAPTVAGLAVLLALAPLGSAAFHPAGTGRVSRALPRRRGTAVAIFMLGGTLGSSLGPVLGAWLFARRSLGASPWLLPAGLAVAALMVAFLPADRPSAGQGSASLQPQAPVPPAVFLIVVASFCVSWVESALAAYAPLLITGRGEPLSAASHVLFAYSAAAAAGILAGGSLSDRIPRWQVIALALGCSGPLHAGVILLGGPWRLLLPAALGFFSALSHPAFVALAQELMPDRTSLAAALTMGFSWVLGSLGMALTGGIADRIGVQAALLANSALPGVGLVSIVALWRRTARRPQRAGAP